MPGWAKHALFLTLLVVFAACDGGCGGCSECGITPLANGFDQNRRMDNAVQVRLTESGLNFLESNLGPLASNLIGDGSGGAAITFEVPQDSVDTGFLGITAEICQPGPDPNANPPRCLFEADLAESNLDIRTEQPADLVVDGTLAARLQDLPIGVGFLGTTSIRINADANCNSSEYAQIPATVRVGLETDQDPNHPSRVGYSRVVIKEITIDQDAIGDQLVACGGALGALFGILKSLLLPQFIDPLVGSLSDIVEEQLCMSEDPATGVSCPGGSTADGSGVCQWDVGGGCVPIALGLDGNINLSEFLASISPGTKGSLDFMAAAGGLGDRGDGRPYGDLNPAAQGATISLMGGAEPQPTTTCVPIAQGELPAGIPQPDELLGNDVSGWTGEGPHVGIGISERFLNHAFLGAYNSGALCLGVGSDLFGSLLTSDTLGLLIPSVKDMAWQRSKQPLALVLRPQAPPTATVGNGTDLASDPLLRVGLPQLIIDFYIWSNDRYIRGFSAQFDLDVPVNLDVDANSDLVPVLDEIGISNPQIFNAPLFLPSDDPVDKAQTLANLLGSVIGDAIGGAIPAVSLNDLVADFGLRLRIPPTVEGQGSPGLRRLEKGSDRFLGIFAAFEAPTGNYMTPTETEVRVMEKRVTKEGLVLDTINADNRPEVDLHFKSSLDDGSRQVEWQWRLNNGFWRPWTRDRYVTLDDIQLVLQGRHKIEVRSREVGNPITTDAAPSIVEVIIDKTEPELILGKADLEKKQLAVEVFDVVSPLGAIELRYALDDNDWSEWLSAEDVEAIDFGDASNVAVQARDEEGNVAEVERQVQLIRGRPDPTLGGGDGACDCSVPGGGQSSTSQYAGGLVGLLFGFGFFLRRRRQRGLRGKAEAVVRRSGARGLLKASSLAALSLTLTGCGCSDSDGGGPANVNAGAGGEGGTGGTGGSAGGMGGSGGTIPSSCPGGPNCELLEKGLIGAYASAAVDSTGTVWVSGYADWGYLSFGGGDAFPQLLGDVAVGSWDGTDVTWEVIDGAPDGEVDPTTQDPNNFRGGQSEEGDNVGIWTSLAVAGDVPMVAYQDVTNKSLKFARKDGDSWVSHEIQAKDSADIGRYASLVIRDGNPVIAYLAMEPVGDGTVASVVRLASASSATPTDAADWAFTDVFVLLMACQPALCGGDECREDGLCMASASGCMPDCGADQECFDNGGNLECANVIPKNTIYDFPNATGLFIDLKVTPDGLGMVFYDRQRGNLIGMREVGGAWEGPLVIDGQIGNDQDTGDVGIGASLFVDGAGDWHVAYADGIDEQVLYNKVVGFVPEGRQVVDTGATDDGQAVVGDDTSIWVNGSGSVFIAYQDATNGKLKWATNESGNWTNSVVNTEGWTGAFNTIVDVNGSPQVATHWRVAQPRTEGSVRVVQP